MATLENQYQSYIKENPDSDLSFIQWFEKIFMPKLEAFKKAFGEKSQGLNPENPENPLIP